MGQFKPMVKMMTTEPTVELKLKKGGSAHKKMKHGGDAGHKPMQGKMNGGIMGALAGATPVIAGRTAAPVARVPSRPSMASRRRSMMAKAPIGRRVMKEGGESKAVHASEMKKLSKVESELKSHKDKPASKAHKGLNKGGACYKDGGLAKSGIINTENQGGEYRNTKMHSAEKTTKTSGKTGDVKYGNGGGYKTGGVVLGNGGGYKTGGVALGNAGGYKKGGASKKAYANGGSVNDEGKAVSMPQGNKKPSTPVSINKLSGTFKKGGTVAEKKLQGFFKKENATAMKESKAKLLDKYSPYQKADGGPASDKEYESVIKKVNEKNERSYGKKMDILKGQGAVTENEREIIRKYAPKYPSGMSDSDIDKVINSKEFEKSSSSFIDKKRGGKVGK